jgi:hypothetical protein
MTVNWTVDTPEHERLIAHVALGGEVDDDFYRAIYKEWQRAETAISPYDFKLVSLLTDEIDIELGIKMAGEFQVGDEVALVMPEPNWQLPVFFDGKRLRGKVTMVRTDAPAQNLNRYIAVEMDISAMQLPLSDYEKELVAAFPEASEEARAAEYHRLIYVLAHPAWLSHQR